MASTLRYTLSVVSVLLAFGLRMWIQPYVDGRVPFITFFLAVGVTAWYGGLGPTLVAVALSGLAAAHFFMPPADSLLPADAPGWVGLSLFVCFGFATALLSERMRGKSVQLHRREQDLSDFFDNAAIGLHWVGRDGTILRVNQAELDLLGYAREEYIGRHIAEFHLDQPVIDDILARLARGETLRDCPARLRCKDGSIRDVLVSSNVLFEDGRFLHTRCFTRDVTDEKRALEALREREERYALVVAGAEAAIWDWDVPAKRVVFSPRWKQLRGLADDEVSDREEEWSSRIHPDDAARVIAAVGAHFAGETPVFAEEYRVRHKDGHWVWILDRGIARRDAQGRVIRMAGSETDVTERKQAEEALRESEQRLRLALEAGRMGTWEWDILSGRVAWSPMLEEIHGLPPGGFAGTFEAYQKDIHPDDRQRVLELIREAVDQGRDHHLEYRIVRPDGDVRWLEARGRPFRNDTGQPVRLVGVCSDVTERKRTEHALKSKEAELELIAETTPLSLTRCSRDLRYRFANRAAAALFGLAPHEMIGERILDVMGEQTFAMIEPRIEQVLRGEPVEYEVELPYLGAGPTWVRVNYIPERDEQGNVEGWIASIVDITERKRMEQSLQFLAEASRSLSALVDYKSTLQKVARLAVPHFAEWCAVDMLDDDGVLERVAVAHVDPAKVELAQELYRRYPADPDAPRGVMHVLRTGEPEMISEISDDLLEEAARDEAHLRIMRELNLKSYLGVPLTSKGKTLGVMVFVSAQSSRRYRADDLAMAEDLAHRAAIAIENARLYQELRDADRRKDDFLAMLAHELRNPLAPIRSGLDVLAMDGGAQQETVRLMQEQVDHVVRLVDDLLDVSRIMRGKVELRRESVELERLVRQSVAALRPQIDSQEQELALLLPDQPLWIHADPVRIVQVFENLLGNASKYTPAGGRIELTVAAEDDHAFVIVRDTGVGIERELLPKVFDLFTQSTRSLDRSQGGLGIGLTLVRNLVQMHGGAVSAQSEGPGRGSTFTVRLPLTDAAPQAAAAAELDVSHRRRVLVVDDHVGAAQMLSLVLTKLDNHEVELAYDGPSALAKVRETLPEVVFLDIGLPGMDGYQVGRAIRDMPECNGVLLIALTGYGQEEDRKKSLAAGFDEHLVKPPSMDQIKAVFTHPRLAHSQPIG